MSFVNPQKNIEQFRLGEGMHVADLGSGSGRYVLEIARAVKGSGKVYAVDIQKDLLERVKTLSSGEGLSNVELVWGDAEEIGGTKLSDKSMDAVLLSNILFQVENKKGMLEETKRILKPNGKALIIDWTDSFGGLGPSPLAVFDKQSAMRLFSEEGFVFERDISAGDHHYGIIFRNKKV